ncbi:MAG: hypothetical protein RL226_281 [Bacteroidota bacterium]|jgi:acetyl-CoA carboxylase biotin carboxyl carrier protein
MNLTEIQDLIKFVAKSGVNEVEIEQKDFKIIIRSDNRKGRGADQPQQIIAMPMPQQLPAAAPAPAAVAPTAPVAAAAPAAPAAADSNKYIEIKSPMIGTFYRRPAPDKPMFCEVGSTIKTGDVLCIIEAMKLFNEIESEVTGKIVKILVDDNSPIEYDQPLFLVDPS